MVARRSKIYSYKRSFNGFAARLKPHEAKLLSGMVIDIDSSSSVILSKTCMTFFFSFLLLLFYRERRCNFSVS